MNSPFSDAKLNIEGRTWSETVDWSKFASVFLVLFIVLLLYTWAYAWLSIPTSVCLMYFQRELADKIKNIKKNV